MTKYPMTKEIRISTDETVGDNNCQRPTNQFDIRISTFGFPSSFFRHWVLRHSSLPSRYFDLRGSFITLLTFPTQEPRDECRTEG